MKIVKDLFVVCLGNFILALGVSMFILQFNILSGGVAGISIALQPLLHLDPIIIINFIYVTMFIFGALAMGKEFAYKTMVSSLIYPVFISIIPNFTPVLDIDPLLAAIYGGVLCGVGIGLVMRKNSSTGGMDIPPLIMKKYLGINVAVSILVIDAFTVLLGYYSYGLEAVLIGLITVVASSYTINKTLTFGGKSSKSVQIISESYLEIMEKIHSEINRGTTVMDAVGGYTSEKRKVLLVVVDNREYSKLISLINDIDNKAFVITTDTMDVHGEGFKLEFKI